MAEIKEKERMQRMQYNIKHSLHPERREMVTEFCGFRKGVIGKELPKDSTLNNMKKSELIELLHTAQHNYETLMFFYSNAVNANMRLLNEAKKEAEQEGGNAI